MNNQDVVFDAFAIFVYLNKEEGAELVKDLLKQARQGVINVYLHRINWGEVYYKTYKENGEQEAEQTIKIIDKLPIIIEDAFLVKFIKAAATIKGEYPVSYADAFAINLALAKKIPLVTGDPEITKIAKQESRLQLLWG